MVRDRKASHDGWFWGWFGWRRWAPDWPAAAEQPLSEHGLRPVLHQLPRLREGQLDLRVAQEHQGRARRAAGVPQPEFLPRPVVAKPAQRIARPADRGRAPAAPSRLQPGLPRASSGRWRAALVRRRPATPSPRCRRRPTTMSGVPARRTAPGERTSSPRISASAATMRRRHRPAIRHDRAGARTASCQHLALWHLARLADGAGGTRSDLLRPAGERDRNLPPRIGADRGGHLPRLSRHRRPAPVRHRSLRRRPAAARRSRARSVDAVPFPDANPRARLAHYGALARDGISCTACHHMVLGKEDTDKHRGAAAEQVRERTSGLAQSRAHGFRQDLHRQLPARRARRPLRAVSRSRSRSR